MHHQVVRNTSTIERVYRESSRWSEAHVATWNLMLWLVCWKKSCLSKQLWFQLHHKKIHVISSWASCSFNHPQKTPRQTVSYLSKKFRIYLIQCRLTSQTVLKIIIDELNKKCCPILFLKITPNSVSNIFLIRSGVINIFIIVKFFSVFEGCSNEVLRCGVFILRWLPCGLIKENTLKCYRVEVDWIFCFIFLWKQAHILTVR